MRKALTEVFYVMKEITMAEKSVQRINSVARAIQILELYPKLNAQYLGVSEISKALGLQKTSTFYILKTLLSMGWLIQETPNGKYKLGTRLLRVSAMVSQNVTAESRYTVDRDRDGEITSLMMWREEVILQEMNRLLNQYNEDVVLTAMVDGLPICVEKVHSSNMLRIQSKVGRVSNLLRGSTGKALFAWQSQDFIQETLEEKLSDPEEREQMRSDLDQIREQGYCISISEQDTGVMSVAVPIRDQNGVARYSLAVIGEEKRMLDKGIDPIREDLVNTACQLEESLRLLWE